VTAPASPWPKGRRWPLLVIGASAGTATWSGWVGLGALTGFGLVHPLPGIWDGLTLNTAITLPVGVEAYAVYALSVATDPRPLTDRARRYAWGSAAAALLLGMGGQIAYHLVDHQGAVRAPWWVTALVSCLPVLVLGAASLLWHLAGQTPDAVPAEAAAPVAAAPDPAPAVPGAPSQTNAEQERVHPPDPAPSAPEPETAPADDDAALIAAVLATDPLPSARQIKATYRIGQTRAARIRAAAVQHRTETTEEKRQEQQPDQHHTALKIIKTEEQESPGEPPQETHQSRTDHDTHATALP
jgi:hypothetical protein